MSIFNPFTWFKSKPKVSMQATVTSYMQRTKPEINWSDAEHQAKIVATIKELGPYGSRYDYVIDRVGKVAEMKVVAATGHAIRHPSNPFGRPISKVLPPKVTPNRRKNDAPAWDYEPTRLTPSTLTFPPIDFDTVPTAPAVFQSGGGGDFGGGGATGSWDASPSDSSSSSSSSDSSSSSSSSSD